jgi:hypothetical protein
MLERLDILELGAGCPLHGVQRFARRVRDEVDVEVDGGPDRACHGASLAGRSGFAQGL